MKKSVIFIISLIVLSQVSVVPISALEIIIDDQGSTLIYQDGVLGDTTETSDEYKKTPQQKITENQEKMLRVRNSGQSNDVEIIDKSIPQRYEAQKMNSERLRLQMQANPDRRVATSSAERRLMLKDAENEEVRANMEDRANRADEKIELRRATAASSSSLELRSKNARAIIPEQREIVIDPETNEVGMVLPNGEIKALNHLPDQAQAKIDAYVENSEELQLTTLADGRVVYVTTVPKVYRFLGLFKRQIPTKVILDDSSGAVTEEKEAETGFSRFLNRFSF